MRVESHFVTKDPSVFATYRRVVDVARTFGPVAEEAKKTSIHLVRITFGVILGLAIGIIDVPLMLPLAWLLLSRTSPDIAPA